MRSSAALGADRMDTRVGPLRVEVLEGLRRLRVVCEPTDGLGFDLTFTGTVPATLEPRHFHRQLERVTFDTQRFVQTGHWEGTLVLDGTEHVVTPETGRGNRDRSWGVRPVGEAEPPGRRADPAEAESGTFFWIYAVAQFEDFSVYVVIQEDAAGRRIVEDAMRVWREGRGPATGGGSPAARGSGPAAGGGGPAEPEWLGRPEHAVRFTPGTRSAEGMRMEFVRPGGGRTVLEAEVRLPHLLGLGTGYGLEPDWRHGMWQGREVTQSVRHHVPDVDPVTVNFCPVDNLARFTLTEEAGEETAVAEGSGLFEIAAIGPHAGYGFADYMDGYRP